MTDDDVRAAIDAERRLLDPLVRTDPVAVEALLDPEFTEVGRSGRRWDRQAILAMLATESPHHAPPTTSDLRGVRLADNVVHLTYTSERDGQLTHRSSVWRRSDDSRRVYYHQGTPA